MTTTPIDPTEPGSLEREWPELATADTAAAPALRPAVSLPGPSARLARRQEARERVARQRQERRYARALRRAGRGRYLSRRAALTSLHLEQELHGGAREASSTTFTEVHVRSAGKVSGDRVLRRTSRKLGRIAVRQERLHAKRTATVHRADGVPQQLVAHPDGGRRTVAETRADQVALQHEIAAEVAHGSTEHRRLSRLLTVAPVFVLVMDAALLSYFMSGIMNVDWSSPDPYSLFVALAAALAITGAGFGAFTLVGEMLNHYKDDDGRLGLGALDGATKVWLLLALLGIGALAGLMAVRMHEEVVLALGDDVGPSAMMLAITMAVVSLLMNSMVIAVHALDGSGSTRRLARLGRAVRRGVEQERTLRRRAARLDSRIAHLDRRGQRTAARGRARASEHLTAVDQWIDAGRALHQGTGLHSDAVTDPNPRLTPAGYRSSDGHPDVDERAVQVALGQLATPAGPAAERT